MKLYKIKKILNARGQEWYYEIYKRSWLTLFRWRRKSYWFSYETALAYVGSRRYIYEVWTYEGGDGILKRKKNNGEF